MNSFSPIPSVYQVGGSLPLENPTYVARQADKDFYQRLKAGDLCYVLNSRQMGKSSLRVRTMERLQQEGIACTAVDITLIGTQNIDTEQWYFGICNILVNDFELYDDFDLDEWWTRQGLLSPVQKFSNFLRDILLQKVKEKIVIFVDEIDSILGLPFKDDFFALIRACYNQRVGNADFERLSFGFLGVATPSELMSDISRTPFNIGTGIELKGFQLGEVRPLEDGLQEKVDNPHEVLKAVLDWTGGQPFLTQRVCQLILNPPFPNTKENEREFIDKIVREKIIEDWEIQDTQDHLKHICKRLTTEQRAATISNY